MGLDMYCFKTKDTPASPVDFEMLEGSSKEIFYWRKHPDLHGWMEQLYEQKGGAEEFNCANVVLTIEDIEKLELEIKNAQLPSTSGFFFGQSTPEDKETDLEFIVEAKQALKEGYNLYYTSWW